MEEIFENMDTIISDFYAEAENFVQKYEEKED